ncbi:hypothetical protein [Parasphingorhabdus sp.]|uniref:hypothetical protein n=1 Tax=Parasphingorhabdus sp. TaxID=2709688 RepID=UPI0030033E2B
MLKQRQNAAKIVAGKLETAEEAVDKAIGCLSDLIGYLPVARMDAHLSAVVGQKALSAAADSLSSLIEARRHLVETHNNLADTRDQIGLKAMAMGSGDMKPPMAAQGIERNIVPIVDHAA